MRGIMIGVVRFSYCVLFVCSLVVFYSDFVRLLFFFLVVDVIIRMWLL